MGRRENQMVRRKIIDLLQRFRPFTPDGMKSVWHEQIKGFLCTLGMLVSAIPVPEYPIPSVRPRGGIGRIDVVWLVGSKPAAAFEIDSGIKIDSIKKLDAFPAMWKFILSAGPNAGELKLLGSRRLAETPDIRHIVIEPTDDEKLSWASAMEAIPALIEFNLEAVKEPKPTTLEVD